MKHIFLLSLLLWSINANSQIHWSENASGLTFVADLDTNFYGPESYDFYYDSIKIYILNQETQKWIQVFRPMELPGTPSFMEHAAFIVEDLNFDGFADFRVMTGYYINGAQTDYDCYLWNPAKIKFVIDSSISVHEGLYVDHKKKILHFHWRSGFEVFGHCVYQWQKDKFVEVAFQESTSWPEGGQVVNRKMVDGVMTESIWPGEDWLNIPHDECDLW